MAEEERERDGQGEIGKREKIQTLKEKSRQFEEKKDKKAYYGNRTEKTFELKSSSTRENVRSKIFLPPAPLSPEGISGKFVPLPPMHRDAY